MLYLLKIMQNIKNSIFILITMRLRKRLMMLYLLLVLKMIQDIIVWLSLHILISTHYFLIRRTLIVLFLAWMKSHATQKIIIWIFIRVKFNRLNRLCSKIKKIIFLNLYSLCQAFEVKFLSLSRLFVFTSNWHWFKRQLLYNILSYINS